MASELAKIRLFVEEASLQCKIDKMENFVAYCVFSRIANT